MRVTTYLLPAALYYVVMLCLQATVHMPNYNCLLHTHSSNVMLFYGVEKIQC